MATTQRDHPQHYIHDDPTQQEPRGRRYAWTALLYGSFAALIALLFLMVR